MSPDVALVTAYPPSGGVHEGFSGVASYSANLARALARCGVDTRVIAPKDDDSPARSTDDGVVVERPFARGAFAPLQAIKAALDLEPAVVHLQHETFLFGGAWSLAGWAAGLTLLRRSGVPGVATLHQVVDPGQLDRQFMRMHRVRGPVSAARTVLAVQQRLVGDSVDATIVHEPAFARILPQVVGIPHGMEEPLPVEREVARLRLGLEGEERLVVLCFGFLAPYKGLEVALEAAAMSPHVRLVVAGGPHPRHGSSYADDLRKWWGTEADFVGHIPEGDISDWHSAADLALFCYPAPHASSGALAVAIAHGTPALLSEALVACMGAPGEMAVTTDVSAVATRLRHLAEHPLALAELRRLTRNLAAGRSWPEVARRHLRLYEQVTGRKSGHSGRITSSWKSDRSGSPLRRSGSGSG